MKTKGNDCVMWSYDSGGGGSGDTTVNKGSAHPLFLYASILGQGVYLIQSS